MPWTSRSGLGNSLNYAAVEEVTTSKLNISVNLRNRMFRYVNTRLYQDIISNITARPNSKTVTRCATLIVMAVWQRDIDEDEEGNIDVQLHDQNNVSANFDALINTLPNAFRIEGIRDPIWNMYKDLLNNMPAIAPRPLTQYYVTQNPELFWPIYITILRYIEKLENFTR